jgi:hypothetical protein
VAEDWSKGSIVKLVDHLDCNIIDYRLRFINPIDWETFICAYGPLSSEVEGVLENLGKDRRIFGYNTLWVLVNGGAENIKVLPKSLCFCQYKLKII